MQIDGFVLCSAGSLFGVLQDDEKGAASAAYPPSFNDDARCSLPQRISTAVYLPAPFLYATRAGTCTLPKSSGPRLAVCACILPRVSACQIPRVNATAQPPLGTHLQARGSFPLSVLAFRLTLPWTWTLTLPLAASPYLNLPRPIQSSHFLFTSFPTPRVTLERPVLLLPSSVFFPPSDAPSKHPDHISSSHRQAIEL